MQTWLLSIAPDSAKQKLPRTARTPPEAGLNAFTLPGLGKLVGVRRKAGKGRNPATGETIRIPTKRALKFRVAKAAKDAIMPPTATRKTAKKTAKRR